MTGDVDMGLKKITNLGDLVVEPGDGQGVGFWNSAVGGSYRIYMSASSNGTHGGRAPNETTSDYNMYFKMNAGTNRGFVFRTGTTNIAGIDSSGNFNTNGQFKGRATSANWADLAEKYEADAEYPEGTVLAVGGSKEVTKYQDGMPLAGVVSLYPGFKMNNTELTKDWPFVALKGRVPVKITGQANKGDYILADADGKGIAVSSLETFEQQQRLIGIALETGRGSIEVKI
jgi:hypothetical protein